MAPDLPVEVGSKDILFKKGICLQAHFFTVNGQSGKNMTRSILLVGEQRGGFFFHAYIYRLNSIPAMLIPLNKKHLQFLCKCAYNEYRKGATDDG